ncbi:MAG: phage tail protein [Hyphomicrobium sp.]|nr:phage tail protein [Hyphomicrobium sp.]
MALSIRLHATNNKDCTLSVDGSAAKPIRGFTGKSLSAGVGIAGTPYRVIYVAATQEWIFSGFFQNPYQIPIGGFLPFCSTAVPNSNFILPFGQALSRTTYAELYNLIGTAFGAGDGASTFNAPDLRGRTIFGLDNMGGAAAGRLTTIAGTTVGGVGGAETVALARSNLPNVQLALSGSTSASGDHQHLMEPDSAKTGSNAATPGGFYTSSGDAGTRTPASKLTNLAGNHAHSVSGATESMNGGVEQTAINKLPPAIVLPMLLRVL